jgi:hypothetical protein
LKSEGRGPKPERNPNSEARKRPSWRMAAKKQEAQRSGVATEPLEAYGVRGACFRCRKSWIVESGSKLHALHTLRGYPCPKVPRNARVNWDAVLQKRIEFRAFFAFSRLSLPRILPTSVCFRLRVSDFLRVSIFGTGILHSLWLKTLSRMTSLVFQSSAMVMAKGTSMTRIRISPHQNETPALSLIGAKFASQIGNEGSSPNPK